MSVTRNPVATALAWPVDLTASWNASDARAVDLLHPLYGQALARLPEGDQVFRGLPFRLGRRGEAGRWLVVDRAVSIDLAGSPPASHVVVAHFCDAHREADGSRPAGVPIGWVEPVGEALARYELVTGDGVRLATTVRRRFEVNEGILGWGAGAFLAVGHRLEQPMDWRGPHERQPEGRYAAAGHAGPMTVLPGAWGPAQTGVADFVPSPSDDVMLWLHAIPLDDPASLAELRLEPTGPAGPGRAVIIAGITLFRGTADPLVLGPRRQLLVRGMPAGADPPEADLGIVIRTARAGPSTPASRGPIGWGSARVGSPPSGVIDAVVDIAVAPDARLRLGDWELPVAGIGSTPVVRPGSPITIQALPPPATRVAARIVDAASGEPVPARVRFTAADGRYLPPLGHRDEVNPGLYEDTGADLLLGGETYAYVPGSFELDLPLGQVLVEAVRGFECRPARMLLEVGPETDHLELELERPVDLRARGWATADPHVHFLAPSTALLQAAAEDLSIIHLLATQWGDHATSVTDLPWGSMSDPSGRHRVVLGTENRQNMLGHLGLLGARRPVLPMASGGAPEGRIGAAVVELMADWADRCHAADGLVVAAHFPLPYAEIAADIVSGRIDAIELQCFSPGLDHPSILEWYRFLDLGYRLPVLGGTDKMSAEVPAGAVRTYAQLAPGEPPTSEAWAAAVRAGRTFATSGPLIQLEVEGHGPGDVLTLPGSGGRLEVRAEARAAQSVIVALELVVNGTVVAAETAASGTETLDLAASIDVRSGCWVAARARSDRQIESAFATSMAAHTSPVYVEVLDRPLLVADEAGPILEVIEGTRRWLASMAAVEPEAQRARMVGFLAESGARLRARLDRAKWEVH